MPNHVINELNFIGEQKDIDKILSLIHGEKEDQYIDFNKIIPMPDYIYRGDLGRKEQELYGKNNWYDWSIDHWGTKWNAYYQEKKENTIFFNTAWSIPYPIYEKLAEICYENTEIAIGGGNPLEHPRLEEFLIKCRKLDLIPNITVNQKHLIRPEYRKRLERMTEENLIFGLGVSVNSQPHKDLLKILEKFPNAVIHTINGITDDEVFTELAHHNLKILILGYKNFGRGVPYKKNNLIELYNNQEWLHDSLPEIIEQKWFDVVSFDNLAIEQLEVKKLMSADEWDSFYMGDDGKFTMYIDAVTRTAAKSSTTPMEQRIPLEDDIEEMFKKINSNIKEN